MASDRDFYVIKHGDSTYTWPRVTSILRIIDKSDALIGWATKMTTQAFRLALEDVLTRADIDVSSPAGCQRCYDEVMKALEGKRAHVRAREEAAEIGGQAHDLIRWLTLGMLGQDPGKEPKASDPALRAVDRWIDWTRVVGFKPLYVEYPLYCEYCGIAGTTDTIAEVNEVVTVIDYKTAPPPKSANRPRVYPESLIQTNFYRHMASIRLPDLTVAQTMVVRLPKVEGDMWDAKKDAVVAPEVPLRLLQGVTTTWRTMQWITGEAYGSSPVGPHPAPAPSSVGRSVEDAHGV